MADSSRRAALATLAAELGHELQGPLNLFRLVTDRAARGEPLDAEDVSLLHEELDRLSAINARLRRLATTSLTRRCWSPAELTASALERSHAAAQAELELELTLGRVVVDCDRQLMGLALYELLDNALGARAERAGVRFANAERTGFCVWDDGPGFALDPGSAMAWGATTKPGAAGIGLTLALRVARAHGFRLEVSREGSETQVWLMIPAREVREDPSKLAQ